MARCLPPPLMTSEPRSYARETIERRKPGIIADVLSDHEYSEEVRQALDGLAREIAGDQLAPPPSGIPLYDEWLGEYRLWEGRGWLEVPWYFAESYFYVRLLAAIGYFEGRARDPFEKRKQALLAQCGGIMPSLAQAEAAIATMEPRLAFGLLSRRSLWGNRADLSNLVIAERHRDDPAHLEDTDLVVDDTDVAFRLIATAPERPITFICDNCGPEVVADLHLADWLLRRGQSQVALELKSQPFFVSDAMLKDAKAAIGYLAACELVTVRRLGRRLQRALDGGRLLLRDHAFWSGPHHYSRLPPDLAQRLAASCLVIAKGDVNYRRFLEDRHWPFQTPVSQAVDFFPADALLLRTLKGELIVGLDGATVERLAETGDDWLTNGRNGLVQYVPQGGGRAS